MPTYLTLEEAANRLNVSKSTLRNRIKSGSLPAQRLAGGRKLLIDASHLAALLEPARAATRQGKEPQP